MAWDVGLHLDQTPGVVSAWYRLLCVGFDLVVVGYLLRRMNGRNDPTAPLAFPGTTTHTK
jgi:hypothetical protein